MIKTLSLNSKNLQISVIIDHANDPSASTGDFELIHVCPIGRYYPPQKIQLNIDGKKINPSTKQGNVSRSLFRLRNFSDLIVKGEKLFKPLKARLRTIRTPMEMKHVNFILIFYTNSFVKKNL